MKSHVIATRCGILIYHNDEKSSLLFGRSVAIHFQGTGLLVGAGMLAAGLGVESYMLGQVILIHLVYVLHTEYLKCLPGLLERKRQ